MPDESTPLSDAFRRRGFAFEVRHGVAVPTHGPRGRDAEIRAGDTGPVFADRAARGVVVDMLGADRQKFLHGQCTQEVKAKSTGDGGMGWMLDARGVNLGPVRFAVLPDRLQMEFEPADIAARLKRMEMFVITADVTLVRPMPAPAVLQLGGRGAAEALRRALPGASPPTVEDACTVFETPSARFVLVGNHEAGDDGVDVRIFAEDAAARTATEDLIQALERGGAIPIGDDALDAIRIRRGRPRFGVDAGPEHTPAETSTLERTVSFTKGCYAGQEVVAKQQYLGKPRKQLVRVRGATGATVGAILLGSDGAEAGRMGSTAAFSDGVFGLATVKPASATPGVALKDETGGLWTVL